MEWLWCFWWKVFCWQNGSEWKNAFSQHKGFSSLTKMYFIPRCFGWAVNYSPRLPLTNHFTVDWFFLVTVKATGDTTNTTTIGNFMMLQLVQYSLSANWGKDINLTQWAVWFSPPLPVIYILHWLQYYPLPSPRRTFWELPFSFTFIDTFKQ